VFDPNKNKTETSRAGFSERGKPTFDAEKELEKVLKGDLEKTLNTEDFEESQEALQNTRSLLEFRKKARASSSSFLYKLSEGLTKISSSDLSREKKDLLKRELIEKLTPEIQKSSPRVSDFYKSLFSLVEGGELEAQWEMTDKKVKNFLEDHGLDVLSSKDVDWQKKHELIEKRLDGYLRGAKALDDIDRKKKKIEKQKDENINPPEADDESKPGMDEMERNEGDEMPPAIWSIHPAYGGYYKQQSYDVWDGERNVWKSSGYEFENVDLGTKNIPAEEEGRIMIGANIFTNKWARVPIPYTHKIVAKNIAKLLIKKDQNGDYLVFLQDDENKIKSINLVLQKIKSPEEAKFVSSPKTEAPKMNFQLTEETLKVVEEIRKNKKGKLAQAYALASHTIRHLNYSNDSSFNSIYNSHENGYVGAIDIHKQADCDVGNTYFAGLCSLLDIPVRHCVGHMVKGKDKEGDSRITSGTGHAWSEVYDETKRVWVRIDATPSGDPQLDEEKEKNDSIPVSGDYGEQEAVGHTDEQLEAIEKELEKLNTELSYTLEERELAKGAGIDLKQAREIMKEIKEAENLRLKDGSRIVDVLSNLFNMIVEERKIHQVEYRGPLREREGGDEIEDLVEHSIGIRSKDFDPISRVKPYDIQKKEKVMSGFDLYLVGDKSGSMSQTVSGEAKWKIQRLAQFLLFSSLNRFDQRCKGAGIEKKNSLGIRTQAISFRDSNALDEDKPLSEEFGPKEKLELWRSMGDQGSGNGDVAALSRLYGQIKAELGIKDDDSADVIKKKIIGDSRLRIVIACSDGYPDNAAGVRTLAKKLSELGVVVVGIGMTETAKAVKTIFSTEYSKGDYVESIDELPMVIAHYVITEAIKLFPQKARESSKEYQSRLEKLSSKFSERFSRKTAQK